MTETKKVLIVDDEMSIHQSLGYVLKQYNLEVLHATSGIEAVEVLKKHTPALIFLDFKLPGPNGIQVAKKIQTSKRLKNVPIIGITAYASEKNREIAKNNGVLFILEKPFDLVELQKIINNYIK